MVPFIAAAAMLFIASFTVFWSARISNSSNPSQKVSVNIADPNQQLSSTEAMFLPLTSSVFLLVLYYFFDYVQYFFVFFIATVAATSVYQVIWIALAPCAGEGTGNNKKLQIATILLTCMVTLGW
jgi:hypothetical protein